MGAFSAFFGCRGVAGFSGCCSGMNSGDGGFMLARIGGCRGATGFNGRCLGASSGVWDCKFLVIAACRGGTGFICPLPELWAGLLVVPRVFRAPEGPAAREAPAGTGLLVAPRVFRAPEGPAAREARRPHFVRRRASKPARALRSLRRPPHQWGLVADSARRLVVRPGPAAAHGHRIQARATRGAIGLRTVSRR